MKTKLIVEIETPDKDKCKVIPENLIGVPEAEYTEAQRDQVSALRISYSEELHESIVEQIKREFSHDEIEERLMDDALFDMAIEDWNTLEDYDIKINVTIEPSPKTEG